MSPILDRILSIALVGKLTIGAPVVALLLIITDRVVRHEVREHFVKRCLTV